MDSKRSCGLTRIFRAIFAFVVLVEFFTSVFEGSCNKEGFFCSQIWFLLTCNFRLINSADSLFILTTCALACKGTTGIGSKRNAVQKQFQNFYPCLGVVLGTVSHSRSIPERTYYCGPERALYPVYSEEVVTQRTEVVPVVDGAVVGNVKAICGKLPPSPGREIVIPEWFSIHPATEMETGCRNWKQQGNEWT